MNYGLPAPWQTTGDSKQTSTLKPRQPVQVLILDADLCIAPITDQGADILSSGGQEAADAAVSDLIYTPGSTHLNLRATLFWVALVSGTSFFCIFHSCMLFVRVGASYYRYWLYRDLSLWLSSLLCLHSHATTPCEQRKLVDCCSESLYSFAFRLQTSSSATSLSLEM